MIPLRIEAIDLQLPPQIQTAEDLADKIGKSAQWIRQRAGVQERRVAQVDMPTLAAQAATKVFDANNPPDLILNASAVNYQVLPDTSVFIQKALGHSGIPCFSIHATCLSFLAALQSAAGFLATRSYSRILIVSADLGTRGRNFNEPESAALLGDGAAAALITLPKNNSASGILAHCMRSFPEGAEFTSVRGGGTRLHPQDVRTTPADNLFHMRGKAVFKMALREAPEVINQALNQAGLKKSDLQLVIPHQASGFGVEVYRRFGFKSEQVVDVVSQYGNCVAASLPMALAHAVHTGRLARGDQFMLVGTGAGLSVASTILRY
jgi:3-oxoacyl-[acyl-carrier-protein] synthase-3